MSEQDFEALIEGLKSALTPRESKFTLSMATIITIGLSIMSGISAVVAFLVIGYYSNYSEIKAGKVVDDWTKASVVQLQTDMKEVKGALDKQVVILGEIRSDQQRRMLKEKSL